MDSTTLIPSSLSSCAAFAVVAAIATPTVKNPATAQTHSTTVTMSLQLQTLMRKTTSLQLLTPSQFATITMKMAPSTIEMAPHTIALPTLNIQTTAVTTMTMISSQWKFAALPTLNIQTTA